MELIKAAISSKLNAVENWTLILQGDLGSSAENTTELSHSRGEGAWVFILPSTSTRATHKSGIQPLKKALRQIIVCGKRWARVDGNDELRGLVSWGYCKKVAQSGWLRTTEMFLSQSSGRLKSEIKVLVSSFSETCRGNLPLPLPGFW